MDISSIKHLIAQGELKEAFTVGEAKRLPGSGGFLI